MKNKDKLYTAVATGLMNPTLKTKHMRLAKYKDLEEALFTWFKNIQSTNLPINEKMIQEKASKITKSLY